MSLRFGQSLGQLRFLVWQKRLFLSDGVADERELSGGRGVERRREIAEQLSTKLFGFLRALILEGGERGAGQEECNLF